MGVVISYALAFDQKNGKLKLKEPTNANWSDTEDGALATLTFSYEILAPIDMARLIAGSRYSILAKGCFARYSQLHGAAVKNRQINNRRMKKTT
jgi:hypothetical protein